MVLREGAELALILRAVELSSEGLQNLDRDDCRYRRGGSPWGFSFSKVPCAFLCTVFSPPPA